MPVPIRARIRRQLRRWHNALEPRALRRARRRGMAALEVVMTTAVVFPMLCFLAWWGIRACRNLFAFIGTIVGSFFM